jgi:hypothetical protein
MVFLVIAGCTLSPGRKLIAKGDIEPEIGVTALLGNPKDGFPAVPNLNAGVRYGLLDHLNIGMSINPLTLAVDGIVMAEPYCVLGVIMQKRLHPALNLHLSFPALISPKKKDVVVFPLLGLTQLYSLKRSLWYISFEVSADGKTYTNGIDIHPTIRGGWEFAYQPWLSLVVEAGLADIGRESIITNGDFGQPMVSIGFCYNISQKRENQR